MRESLCQSHAHGNVQADETNPLQSPVDMPQAIGLVHVHDDTSKPSRNTNSYTSTPVWMDTHSFFAISGGYAVKLSKDLPSVDFFRQIERNIRSNTRSDVQYTVQSYFQGGFARILCTQKYSHRPALTPEGLLVVARYDPTLVPEISVAEIEDKSKANALAKAIVCIQAGWFLIEAIVSLASALPMSLLELNTFAHALCALIIYVL